MAIDVIDDCELVDVSVERVVYFCLFFFESFQLQTIRQQDKVKGAAYLSERIREKEKENENENENRRRRKRADILFCRGERK